MTSSCVVCKSSEPVLLFHKSGHDILRCPRCGLVFVAEQASQESLNKKYNNNEISPFSYYKENQDEDYESFSSRIATIERYHKKGRLLDLGCSTGTFMKAAVDRGWQAQGLDVNRKSVGYARKRGLNALQGFFRQGLFPKSSFDVVVMNDFLEHTIDPGSVVRDAAMLLKPAGILYIVTPNSASAVAKIFRTRWLHLKPDEHLYYFSPKSVRMLLSSCALKVERLHSRGRIRNARILVQKMDSYSAVLSKALGIIPSSLLSKIRININPGDEMEIIGRK